MRSFLILIIIFICSNALAQNIETPVLLSVSVDTTTGRPVVKWSVDNPQLVDGYVVKRLIYDGTGVMPNTYNNVAVIDGGEVTQWEDNSTDFSTFADPENRIEYYRVAAFVNNGTQKKYSLMSQPVSTVTINSEYNRCTNQYTITFTNIKGVTPDFCYVRSGDGGVGERLGVLKSDTVFYYTFPQHNQVRKFAVEYVLSNGQSAFSPVCTVVANNFKVPDILQVESVSVNEQNTLDITVNVSESQDVTHTALVRHLVVGSNDTDTLPLPISTNGNYLITDPNADVSTRYSYTVAVFNECGTPWEFSNSAQNIGIEIATDDATTNHLMWNYPPGHHASSSFTIYSIGANGERTVLDNVMLETEYTHSLSNIIANSNDNTGKFCYQIMQTDISSSSGNNVVEYSNIACVDREPVLFVPNAINPEADILDNRYFRPRSAFVTDYQMLIYNKRGELLFSTTDLNQGWDGKNQSGKLYPPDSYVYIITYRTSSNDKKQKTGMVNLVY